MKTLLKVCVSFLGLLACLPVAAQSEPNQEVQGSAAIQVGEVISGKVFDVASGETFRMITAENREIEVWLAEIEAPEKGQVYWDTSMQVLAEKVLGNEVIIQVVNIKDMEDGYDYVIAQVYVGNRWINREMVAQGWAWHFPQYLESPELDQAELQAKENLRGLWAIANPEKTMGILK